MQRCPSPYGTLALRDRLVRMAVTADDTVDVPAAHAKLLIPTALIVADWDSARTRDIVDPITHEPALALLTRQPRGQIAF